MQYGHPYGAEGSVSGGANEAEPDPQAANRRSAAALGELNIPTHQ
jgi:hypothetical protein